MSVKSSICLGDELLVKSLLACARLIARQRQNGAALRIKGEGGYAPYASAASNLSAFLFAWRESSNVSTRGRPSSGPNCCNKRECAGISLLHIRVQMLILGLKLIAHLDAPAHNYKYAR
jgi:hypothetical protein